MRSMWHVACGMYGYKQKYRQSIGAKESEGKKPHENFSACRKLLSCVLKKWVGRT